MEETTLILTVNPGHRIKMEGGRESVRLSNIINEAAERFERLNRKDKKRMLAIQKKYEKGGMNALSRADIAFVRRLGFCNVIDKESEEIP